ncbi:hypothetical protein DB32_000485 [Sandaracinus amylolyticus]|uniref:Uncharacterized protein n=1 Tax=Sandaracinus amylolyticus TaxID=927083 RepID=A0A0F6VZ56_9BACT|nr:hypothetical protein DB32_000485 [Sandaracinus amylolyticus]
MDAREHAAPLFTLGAGPRSHDHNGFRGLTWRNGGRWGGGRQPGRL